jgi:antitoxin Phd
MIMTIDSQTIMTEDEVKQDFYRATTIAEEFGQAVIFRDHRPKFTLIDLESSPVFDLTDDEKIDVVAARILKRFKPAFEELAK